MARIIAVANQKGGVGKTTTTANLGASLTELNRRVLLVDMDPQGNLTAAFGLEKQAERTIADALLDRQCALPIVSANHSLAGLDLIPSAIPLAGAEAALMNKLGRELRLRDQLATVEDVYDFILIDTPPALGLLTINALVAATAVVGGLAEFPARAWSRYEEHIVKPNVEPARAGAYAASVRRRRKSGGCPVHQD